MSIKLRLLSGFLLLIILFLISFFVNQRLSREVIRNTEYINRSEMVIRNSNQIHKSMIDMQSGYRGYLLTGQESFLDPFYFGLKNIPPLIGEQHVLTSSNNQNKRLDSITDLHIKWVKYASSLIDTRKDTLPEASAKYKVLFEQKVKAGTGKRMNDEITRMFKDYDSDEYAVRRERRKKLEESLSSTRNINLTLTISSIVLALISSFVIIRIITRRITVMVKLAEEISKGNFRNMEDAREDELTHLSKSLNTMSLILEKNIRELTLKNRELDQFAYVVSHDLKAPLRGIDNITTWLEEDHAKDLTPDVKKNIDLIRGRTRRLENMINGLLEYAKIGKVKKALETVDVRELVNEQFDLLVPLSFERSIEGEMPVLYTEKLHLEQVFANLISNAVKYNDKPKGKIVVSSLIKNYYCEFTVKDNGIGIQSQYFEKIFTIFQTLKERDAFESTGVGLAIVKRILENKGCSIKVNSEPGIGTSFMFTWPLEEISTKNERNSEHETYFAR